MLPTAQLQHLRDLENELNKQPTLTNTSGGIEHLMIRQFQVDTAKQAAKKPDATEVAATEDKKAPLIRDCVKYTPKIKRRMVDDNA